MLPLEATGCCGDAAASHVVRAVCAAPVVRVVRVALVARVARVVRALPRGRRVLRRVFGLRMSTLLECRGDVGGAGPPKAVASTSERMVVARFTAQRAASASTLLRNNC